MNWFEFRLFLIEQLEDFMYNQSEGIQVGPGEQLSNFMASRSPSIMPSSGVDFDLNLNSQLQFNWSGFGHMYKNYMIRELSDVPAKLGLVGYSAGVTHFTARTFYQAASKIPIALAIGQAPRNYILYTQYIGDALSGKFPGTDQDFFV